MGIATDSVSVRPATLVCAIGTAAITVAAMLAAPRVNETLLSVDRRTRLEMTLQAAPTRPIWSSQRPHFREIQCGRTGRSRPPTDASPRLVARPMSPLSLGPDTPVIDALGPGHARLDDSPLHLIEAVSIFCLNCAGRLPWLSMALGMFHYAIRSRTTWAMGTLVGGWSGARSPKGGYQLSLN